MRTIKVRGTYCSWGAALALLLAAGCGKPLEGMPPPDLGAAPSDMAFREHPTDMALFPFPSWSEPLTQQATPPPAISGGTLLVLADGTTAVAADPERDQIYIVDRGGPNPVVTTIALFAGDEPGRVVEDGAGRIHVVLRHAGAIATIDLAQKKVTVRRPVCAAPRGIAWEAATDRLHVACMGGELASLAAAGGGLVRTVQLDRDLRDVVVDGDTLVVTRFNSAEVVRLDSNGMVLERGGLAAAPGFAAHVAWRAAPMPGGGMIVVHQIESQQAIPTKLPGGYGGGKGMGGGIVQAVVEVVMRGKKPIVTPSLVDAVLPVDVAVSRDGMKFAVVAAGNRGDVSGNVFPFYELEVAQYLAIGGRVLANVIAAAGRMDAVAVAYDKSGSALVQTREPAAIKVLTNGQVVATIPLAQDSRYDTGHAVFHTTTSAGLACASCHPEGGDDGHVWNFDSGMRRTQNLRGGVMARVPFHWSGDLPDLSSLLTTVMQLRMNGPLLTPDQGAALGHWLNAIPLVAQSPPPDPAAVTRGQALFRDPQVACVSCHNGAGLSNESLVDVGTGGTFKVPSLLGVGFRPPYLHTGCAATLADRFGAGCAKGDFHGHTAQLMAPQIDDLIAYLATL